MIKKFNYYSLFCLFLIIFSLICPMIFVGCKKPSSIGHKAQSLIISKNNLNINYIYEWNRTYGTPQDDNGYGLCIDNNGYIYLTGSVYNASQGKTDAFIVKYNRSGAKLLEINYDYFSHNEVGFDVAVNSSGSIFLVGRVDDGSIGGIGSGGTDGILIRYSPSGKKLLPSYHIGSTYNDTAYGIAIDTSDNVHIVGSVGSSSSGSQLMLRKYTSNLVQIWARSFGGPDDEDGYDLALDSNGDIYTIGTTDSWGSGDTDVMITKYDSAGNFVWNNSWGFSSYDYASGIVIDSSLCLVAGNTNVFYGTSFSNIVLSRFWKNSGSISGWSYFIGNSEDFGNDIAKDSKGNFFVCGTTLS
ncbi:MAG: SBBP repeat-containing protein [Candidatus Helarchaeota archaeon]